MRAVRYERKVMLWETGWQSILNKCLMYKMTMEVMLWETGWQSILNKCLMYKMTMKVMLWETGWQSILNKCLIYKMTMKARTTFGLNGYAMKCLKNCGLVLCMQVWQTSMLNVIWCWCGTHGIVGAWVILLYKGTGAIINDYYFEESFVVGMDRMCGVIMIAIYI